jgi:hypothetical protein
VAFLFYMKGRSLFLFVDAKVGLQHLQVQSANSLVVKCWTRV